MEKHYEAVKFKSANEDCFLKAEKIKKSHHSLLICLKWFDDGYLILLFSRWIYKILNYTMIGALEMCYKMKTEPTLVVLVQWRSETSPATVMYCVWVCVHLFF